MFSGFLKIGDLSDFIAPSQACVVSVEGNKLVGTVDDAEVGIVKLQPKASTNNSSQTVPAAGAGPVKVSLHDCLACSGCVTSAETVLLQHQSIEEVIARLKDPSVTVVVSLSPQSVTSLAALYGVPPAECAEKLVTFLKQRGAQAVFDVSWARDVALIETAQEFVHRYRSSQPAPAQVAGEDGGSMDIGRVHSSTAAEQPLPMLASACPGWVCYAEKTHGAFVLPHISSAKSPQAVIGTVIKRQWCVATGTDPDRVYHCAVMPCYDKKLEASRDDFQIPGSSIPETDSVLATTELHEFLQFHGVDLPSLPGALLDAPFGAEVAGTHGRLYGAPGGSGGYLEHVFRTAALELFGQQLPLGRLPLVTGRNPDLKECTLEVAGRRVLRFAAAYGFRNIQGLMRKIKAGKCEYDYVEIMACPAGCLNGGGQIKPAKGQTAHQLIEHLELLYHSDSLAKQPPQLNPAVQMLYREWVLAAPYSQHAQQLFHTRYHKREKSVAKIGDW